jgi:peptidyl-prolyl cis-trans isomerase SurA
MHPAASPNLTSNRLAWFLCKGMQHACVGLLLICIGAQGQGLKPSGAQSLGAPRLTALSVSGLPALSESPSGTIAADYIVAVVNSEPVTNNEVRQEALRIAQQMAQTRQPQPGQVELMRLALDQLITDKAVQQAARDFGIRIDELAIDQAEQSVARQNQVDVPELRRRIVAQGMSLTQYREQLRNQLSQVRLREREVDARVRVSDMEVEQAIQEQQNTEGALSIHLAQILISVPEDASEAQRTAAQSRARQALARARAGEDFAALARELSSAPDRTNGGSLGLRPANRYPPLFVEAVKGLPEGGISGLVESGAGLHILKVMDRRLAGMTVPQTNARHILLRPSPQMTVAQARDKLLDFKRRIEAGQASFADLARENSQDGSAGQGGDLGWASPGQFVPEFEDAMSALLPGQMAEPLISRFGVHLIQVMQRRVAALEPREQREVVRNQLREKKVDEAYVAWLSEIRGRAYVERRESPQ